MHGIDPTRTFVAIRIAVVTISDTRTPENDTSGDLLAERARAAGHDVVHRALIPDDRPLIERCFRTLAEGITEAGHVDVVLATGGTGITARDVTPEALERVAHKLIPGFGELFRWLSYDKIGTSTIQSRAVAGVVGRTLVFALPGSTSACRDAWDGILAHQLDSRHRPCNFVELLPRLG